MNAFQRLLIAALLAGFTGCASIQDSHYRASKWTEATAAYLGHHEACANPWSDYGLGWREGYYCVATGGDGQLPPVPDCRYWGPGFQTETGRERVNAWYNGFEVGASAAGAACRDAFNEIPSSCNSYTDVPHPFPPHSCDDRNIERYLARRDEQGLQPTEADPARRLPPPNLPGSVRARVEDTPAKPNKSKLLAPMPEVLEPGAEEPEAEEPEVLEYNESDEE
jgi:hypothetical protein